MDIDNPMALFLFISSIALGGLIGINRGEWLVGQRLHALRETVDQMKRRWWQTFWDMIRLSEKRQSDDDHGDSWKYGRRPPEVS
jgi:hypothetical protein